MSLVENKSIRWRTFLKIISPKILFPRMLTKEYKEYFEIAHSKLSPCDSIFVCMFDDIKNYTFTQNNVVIFYLDTFDPGQIEDYVDVFNLHKDKQFYVFSDKFNLQSDMYAPNCKHFQIGLGDQSVLQLGTHATAVEDKNFDSDCIGISLNRQPRNFRLMLISYLLGINFNQYCRITAPLLQTRIKEEKNILNICNYDFYDYTDTILKGWEKAKQNDGITDTTDAWEPINVKERVKSDEATNPLENFNLRLTPIFRHSFVEVVCETNYDYNFSCLTEKTMQNQLGKNFPLYMCNTGYVKYLRDNGFDCFDDIIDHSYDKETDPVLKMVKMIQDNKMLFIDTEKTKNLWIKNSNRFDYNVKCLLKLNTDVSNKIKNVLDEL